MGLAIWFEHGRRKRVRFGLSTAILGRFAIGWKAGYAGLAALEDAGLILVARRHGKNPVVTVLTGNAATTDEIPAPEDTP